MLFNLVPGAHAHPQRELKIKFQIKTVKSQTTCTRESYFSVPLLKYCSFMYCTKDTIPTD